ncbi:DUF833-domain-containing protein [Roridomyces roridus]|uniref:DUF833-domain-containing protein n=1 Tax=Roridomyces roridus TaxID=1738132 RepID=A0AAD7CC57_9AGAR|nr:DUF833-domain-containing protein [Roridomyces roridus]
MCVGFWTLEHPDYALILCANRDEFLARPTRPAAFHSFGSEHDDDDQNRRVLSGLDVSAGGTWLGIAPSTGRIAFLTNITETPQSLPSSRGELAPLFLLAPESPDIEKLYPSSAQYAGFNLLLLSASPSPDGRGLEFPAPNVHLLTNNGARGPLTSRPLHANERRAGGLSNAAESAGGPAWAKVCAGVPLFSSVLEEFSATGERGEEKLTESLFELLRTEAPGPHTRATLRTTICVPPVRVTSNPDTPGPWYATRTATVLLIRRDGRALFVERDVWRLKPKSKPNLQGEEEEEDETELAPPGDGEHRFRFEVGEACTKKM